MALSKIAHVDFESFDTGWAWLASFQRLPLSFASHFGYRSKALHFVIEWRGNRVLHLIA